jgi:AcrR family transcriptional regulator
MNSAALRSRTSGRPTRAERSEATRGRLFEAAATIVGRDGYAEASVARITQEAGVAQGTFYNYFDSRQALLDDLLPEIGKDMLRFIGERTRTDVPEADKELDRFRAFFAFVREVPGFLRILVEAELFAPAGYQRHLQSVATAYVRVLRRARERAEIDAFTDEEVEALVHMLMGAREYLCRRYASAGGTDIMSEAVVATYEKLLSGGLFRKPSSGARSHGARAG